MIEQAMIRTYQQLLANAQYESVRLEALYAQSQTEVQELKAEIDRRDAEKEATFESRPAEETVEPLV